MVPPRTNIASLVGDDFQIEKIRRLEETGGLYLGASGRNLRFVKEDQKRWTEDGLKTEKYVLKTFP